MARFKIPRCWGRIARSVRQVANLLWLRHTRVQISPPALTSFAPWVLRAAQNLVHLLMPDLPRRSSSFQFLVSGFGCLVSKLYREAKRIECTSWRIARKVLRDFPIPPASQAVESTCGSIECCCCSIARRLLSPIESTCWSISFR